MFGVKAIILAMLSIIIVASIAGCAQDKSGNTPIQSNNSTNTFPVYTNLTSVAESNYNDSHGLTASQKMDAISIAVNNDSVRKIFDDNRDAPNRSVQAVTFMNSSKMGGYYWAYFDEGFINQPSLVVTVPLEIGLMVPAIEYYNIFVDLTDRKVIGTEEFSFRAIPASEDVMIKPGSTWYHQLSGTGTVMPENYTGISFLIRANASDISALYPVVASEDEFANFKNGSVYSPFVWKDAITKESQTIDGSKAIEPQDEFNGTATWHFSMRIPHEPSLDGKYYSPKYYYITIENKANRSIQFEFYLSMG
jgi:hypothetical protein